MHGADLCRQLFPSLGSALDDDCVYRVRMYAGVVESSSQITDCVQTESVINLVLGPTYIEGLNHYQ